MNNCKKYMGLITESIQSYIDKALEKFDLSIKKIKNNIPADIDYNTNSRKIQLMSEDGTRLGEGAILPSADWGGNIDTSEFAKTEDIPTKMSQLTNDNNYVTESDLVDKRYLTSHQDISGKVDKVEGKQLTTNDYDDAEKNKLKNLYDNQLTDTIMINGKLYLVKKDGTVIGEGTTISNNTTDELVDYAKKNEVANDLFLNSSTNRLQLIDTTGKKIGNGVLLPVSSGTGGTGSDVDLSNYATISQLNEKVDKITGKQLTTNDYDDIEKSKVKDLYNNKIIKTIIDNGKLYLVNSNGNKIDSGTVLPKNSSTSTGETVDLSEYAKISQLPTKTSQLSNDSGFLTSIPSNYVTDEKLNNKGYLTSHQDLSGYAQSILVPEDLVLNTSTNRVQLVNSSGVKLGNGIVLPTSQSQQTTSTLKNILDFGAVGDGSTDNSSAIQSAIDSVTTGERATIYIPDGVYCINTPIQLKKEITIRGNGICSVIKEGSNFSGTALLYTEDSSIAHTNVIVRDLELRGLKNKDVCAIRYNCVYWGTIQNCRIVDLGGNGIELVGNSAVTETCYVTNNLIIYCLKNGIYTNANTRDVHISGGDIGCHGQNGIELNALSSTVTAVQAVWGNGSNGIYEAGENNQIRVSNIEGNVKFGIYIAGKKLLVTGCKFTANKVNEASPNGQVGIDNSAQKTFIGDCTFLNNVDPNKPVFNYSIANYGTGTVIGANYYESTDKVLSAQPYSIVSFEQVN